MSRPKNGYPLPKTPLAIACPAQTPYNPRRFSAPAAMKAVLPILCALLAAAGQYGAHLLYRYRHLRAIAIPANRDMAQTVAHFSRLPGVNRVTRDRIHQLDSQQGTP